MLKTQICVTRPQCVKEFFLSNIYVRKESVEGTVQSVQEYYVNEKKNYYSFRCIWKIASSNFVMSVCLSVCLPAQNNLDHTGRILMKSDKSTFKKSDKKI